MSADQSPRGNNAGDAAVGSAIAAIFGTIYVWANSGGLAPAATWTLRAIALVIAVIVAAAVVRLHRSSRGQPGRADALRGQFGRGYRIVVAVEVAALIVGIVILNAVLHRPTLVVPWVSVVVGVHFVALARVWSERLFDLLGVAITVCGVAGFVLYALGASTAAIAFVAGVLVGLLLLASALLGVRR